MQAYHEEHENILLFGVLMNKYRKDTIAVGPPDLLLRIPGMIAKVFHID